ncbi:hypothetical protein OH76DRAFT_1489406 [Lentinus brumalis]|uniref:Uncharacterized protein n=1 Tax=Lentinus brumalis TaxID=2498619 RepID=A0A371CMN2_9APHY|nr:hypothetical protein OH76DRAFT_1489406 [Polyporus brumalis]
MCYTTLFASVSRAAGESSSELEAKCPMTEAECTALCAAMVALREMLRAGIVNQLITEAVRKELERRYIEGPQGSSTSLFARTMESAGADADTRHSAPDVGVEYDRYLQWDGELPRRHVLRYLQSLVQPLSTAIEIVAHFCDNPDSTHPLKLDVSHVHVAATPLFSATRVSAADYDSFVDRLLRSVDVGLDDGRIFARMQRALRHVKEPLLAQMAATTTVHPEAALLSLAVGGWCSTAVGDEATKKHLHDVFAGGISRDNTPIILDAGKRCCYCCALLAQLLRPRSESDPGGSERTPLRPLKFVLEPDGTHGIIVPWLPPAGIPLNALREIRARLLGVLRRNLSKCDAQEVP